MFLLVLKLELLIWRHKHPLNWFLVVPLRKFPEDREVVVVSSLQQDMLTVS